MTQRELFNHDPPPPPPFDGPDLNGDDQQRLGRQLQAVREVMSDGGWWTYHQIQGALHSRGIQAETQSISARVRDLRKEKFGGHVVDRAPAGKGLFMYRLRG